MGNTLRVLKVQDSPAEVRRERKEAEEARRKACAVLEIRVEERAAKLAKANEELQNEIAERRRVEEALQEQNLTLRSILESSQAPNFSVDRQYRYTHFNEAHAATMRGIYGTEIELGRNLLDYMNVAADRERAKRNLDRALAGEQFVAAEFSGNPALKRFCYEISHSPIRAADGSIWGVAVFAKDMTEQKQTEAALLSREAYLKAIMDNVPYLMWLKDTEGTFLAANNLFAKSCGLEKAEDVIGKTDLDIWPEDLARKYRADDVEVMATLKQKRVEEQIADQNSLKWFETFKTPILDQKGQLIGTTGIAQDITERKQMEERLLRSQRLEMAGQVAGQVAHDFNNLLTPMTAYPDLVRKALPEGHPVIGYVDLIKKAAQQMATINEDLLTLSRRGHFNQTPLLLNGLVKQALGHMPLPPNTLLVELDLAADLLPISGSAAQLVRVISNLVTNARDAMLDVGSLRIKTENVYLDKDQAGYDRIKVGEYVRLQVEDTGCGMSMETQQRIFEPFFSTKTTDRRRGSGLGLSVVQSIVQDHDGFVDVHSVVGRGTTFSLYFPICREAVKIDQSVEVQRGRERILLVDDDAIQREVAGTLLTSIGYSVIAVASGEEAVAYLREQPVDLVLLDMIMPGGIDGLETYKRMRSLRPAQKAIIVSGYAESERVRTAQDLGAGAFLSKPITLQKLAKAVRDELERQSPVSSS